MSKISRSILLSFAVFVLILQLFNNSSAQDLEVTIRLDAAKPEIVSIEGKRKVSAKQPSRNLSFLTSIAGQEISGDRISNLKLFDSKGDAVPYKRFMPGEYVAESEFVGWSYQIDLKPPKDQRLMARVSWMVKADGALMLGDLLPQFENSQNTKSAKITIAVPSDKAGVPGQIYTSERRLDSNTFLSEAFEDSVFYIGNAWDSVKNIDSTAPFFVPIEICLLGRFQFDSFEATDLAKHILKEYNKLFGDQMFPVTVAITKLPDDKMLEIWEADTRGSYITILTSDTTFKSQSLQQLHEQLRHEMFHLWIPNGVNLSGNYDWFYEGFALYQSLKTGVALNRIRFDDYLDTLSRAYDVDKRLSQKLSLIELSKNRWAGDNNTRIYARGMLVAFLCDLALLEKSKGKRSVTDLLRKLYEDHRPPASEVDGNAAVLELLRSHAELKPIIDRNITGSETIDWSNLLEDAGLEVETVSQTTQLKVMAKPSGRQKDLLDRLGYNNWRKLLRK